MHFKTEIKFWRKPIWVICVCKMICQNSSGKRQFLRNIWGGGIDEMKRLFTNENVFRFSYFHPGVVFCNFFF